MIWLWIVLGTLAGLIALVVIVGSLLPKGHVAIGASRYAKAPTKVWAAVTDLAALPSWWPQVKTCERIGGSDAQPIWRETMKDGMVLELQTLESQPPLRLVRKIVNKLPFGGTWTFEFHDDSGGCRLTVTENGEVYNPIFRFVSRFFMDQAGSIRSFLQHLGKRLGEEVEVRTEVRR